MTEIDHGARCDQHVGEAFPPRCYDCHQAQTDAVSQTDTTPRARARYIPGSECPLHRGYPMPCDRCERDASERLRDTAQSSPDHLRESTKKVTPLAQYINTKTAEAGGDIIAGLTLIAEDLGVNDK